MAEYELTSPTGEVYNVTAPDDAGEEEVFNYFQSNLRQQQTPAPPMVQQGMSDFPDFSNVPEIDINENPLAHKFKMHFEAAQARSLPGTLARAFGGDEAIQAERERIQEFESSPDISNFNEGLSALAGQFAGSLVDPVNLIAAPAAFTSKIASPVLNKLVSSAIGAGGGNVVSDLIDQFSRKQQGLQDEIEPLQTVASAGLGAVAGAGLSGAGSILGKALDNYRIRKNNANLNIKDLMQAKAQGDKDALSVLLDSDLTPEQISSLDIQSARDLAKTGDARRIKKAGAATDVFKSPESFEMESKIDVLTPEQRAFLTERGKGSDIDIRRMSKKQQERLLDLTEKQANQQSETLSETTRVSQDGQAYPKSYEDRGELFEDIAKEKTAAAKADTQKSFDLARKSREYEASRAAKEDIYARETTLTDEDVNAISQRENISPEEVKTMHPAGQRALLEKTKRQNVESGETLFTTDEALSEGESFYSPSSKPTELKPKDLLTEREFATEPKTQRQTKLEAEQSRVTSGYGDRPFAKGDEFDFNKRKTFDSVVDDRNRAIGKIQDDGNIIDVNGEVIGRVSDDGNALDLDGNALGEVTKKGDLEDVQARTFEKRAKEKASKAKADSEEELLKRWKQREQARETSGRAKDQEEQDFYAGKKYKFSTKHKKPNADGTFETDKFGYIKSDKDTPIKFATPYQAAKWRVKNYPNTKNQVFSDIEPHPSGNGWTFKVIGETDVKPSVVPEGQSVVKVEPEPEVKKNAPTAEAETQKPKQEAPAKITQEDINAAKKIETVEYPIAKVKVSKDVEQWKANANPETGVVDPLQGKFNREGTSPIMIYERLNGDSEVTSGRHRLDLAKRSGEETIPAQVFKEADGFSIDDMKTKDIVNNIQNENGSIQDYAKYFRRDKTITEDSARAEGFLGRQKGREGFTIGKSSSDGLFALFTSGRIGKDKTYAIAKGAPNDEAIQAIAIKSHSTMDADDLQVFVSNLKELPANKEASGYGDLFGSNQDEIIEHQIKIAKLVSSDKRKLKNSVEGAKKSLRDTEGTKDITGFDYKKKEKKIKKGIASSQDELNRLDKFSTDKELMKQYSERVNGNKVKLDDVEIELNGSKAEQQATANVISKASSGKLYSGFDPELLRGVSKDIKNESKAWLNAGKDISDVIKANKDYSKEGIAKTIWRNGIDSKNTHFEHLINKAPNDKVKEIIRGVQKRFHAGAGKKGGISNTYNESIEKTANSYLNRLNDSVKNMFGNGYEKILTSRLQKKAVFNQIKNQVINQKSRNINTKVGKTAQEIRDVLDEVLIYAKDAGLNIRETKNFFPRVADRDAVLKNPIKFRDKMVSAFIEHDGAKRDSAIKSADKWIEKLKRQELGLEKLEDTTEGRVISDKVSEALDKEGFYIDDPMLVLGSYIQNITRKAEYARRFGNGQLEKMLDDIRVNGGEDVIPAVQDLINRNTGQNIGVATDITRASFSTVRTMVAFKFLSGTPLLQLAEPILASVRTGNPAAALTLYKSQLKQLVGKAEGDIQIAKDIGAINQWFGDAINSRTEDLTASLGGQKTVSRYLRSIGLEGMTAAQRVGSVKLGGISIDSFTSRILKNKKGVNSSKFFLSELGIPDDKINSFSKWIQHKDGSFDFRNDTSENMELYKTALIRFTDQIIMKPNSALRQKFAETPLGGLTHSLTSFTMALSENVNKRTLRLLKNAVTEKDFDAIDKMRMIAPAIMWLTMWAPASVAINNIRANLYRDPKRKEEAKDVFGYIDNIIGSSAMLGNLSIPYNHIKSITKYGKDPLASLAGPGIGSIGSLVKKTAIAASDINSAKKRGTAGKEIYSSVLEPLALMALSAFAPATALGSGITAATSYAGKHPVVRDKVVETFTGKGSTSKSSRGRRTSRKTRSSRR